MKKSAGILLYRHRGGRLEVLLAHPGGPFWRNRDEGAWTIPKGEIGEGEDPFAAARREFTEEIGIDPGTRGEALAPIRQKGGKMVQAWAIEGECDADRIHSNEFSMEWPPKSGRVAQFPEIDRAGWFDLEEARRRMLPSQLPLLEELEQRLG